MSNEPIQSGMVDGRGLEAAREALLCCPFCGGVPHLVEHEGRVHSDLLVRLTGLPKQMGSTWTIECPRCPCGIIDDDKSAVVAAWNRRAASPNIGEVEVAKLARGVSFDLIVEHFNGALTPEKIDAITQTIEKSVATRIRSALAPSPRQHSSQVVSQESGVGDSQRIAEFAAYWHGQCQAIATILGLPEPEEGFAAVVRDHFDALSTPLTETAKAEHVANPASWREETEAEHIARDIKEGRFPARSERQKRPAIADAWERIKGDRELDRARARLSLHELRHIIRHAVDAYRDHAAANPAETQAVEVGK